MSSSLRLNRYERRRFRAGFTLLETLVTMVIVLVVIAALSEFMTTADRAWQSAAADPFAEAAEAFELVAQNVSMATLEPYRDYADTLGSFRTDPTTAFTPNHLARRSDLDFVCGPSDGTSGLLTSTGRTTAGTSIFFVEPGGLSETLGRNGANHLFNARGYFVDFGADTDTPSFLAGAVRLRWRLREVVQPSEALQVFAASTSAPWITQIASTGSNTAILGENIIGLIVLPERAVTDHGAPLAPYFSYDSRDVGNVVTQAQLPARVRLVLAAIDEASAIRLATTSGTVAPTLIPTGTFQIAENIDVDVASLDASLTARKIAHRIFQRDIPLATSAWSNNP